MARAVRSKSTQSPSKYTSLKRLEEIRANNYIGANGVDYCASEVDDLINRKLARKGIKAAATMTKQYDELETERLRLLGQVKQMKEQLLNGQIPEKAARLACRGMFEDIKAVAQALGTFPADFSFYRPALPDWVIEDSHIRVEKAPQVAKVKRSKPVIIRTMVECVICNERDVRALPKALSQTPGALYCHCCECPQTHTAIDPKTVKNKRIGCNTRCLSCDWEQWHNMSRGQRDDILSGRPVNLYCHGCGETTTQEEA